MEVSSMNTKEAIVKGITELMEKCNDLPLLDLIYKLLERSL